MEFSHNFLLFFFIVSTVFFVQSLGFRSLADNIATSPPIPAGSVVDNNNASDKTLPKPIDEKASSQNGSPNDLNSEKITEKGSPESKGDVKSDNKDVQSENKDIKSVNKEDAKSENKGDVKPDVKSQESGDVKVKGEGGVKPGEKGDVKPEERNEKENKEDEKADKDDKHKKPEIKDPGNEAKDNGNKDKNPRESKGDDAGKKGSSEGKNENDATKKENSEVNKENDAGKKETDSSKKDEKSAGKDEGNNVANGKEQEKKKEDDEGTIEKEVCDKAHRCQDKKDLIACLRAGGSDTQELSLLIQNKGTAEINVTIQAPSFLKIDGPANFSVDKQGQRVVQVIILKYPVRSLNLSTIVIKAGNGECVLKVPIQSLSSLDKQSFFENLPYSSLVTPLYGLYIFIFILLSIGAAWICCKFRGRKRHDDGVKYQELEMSLPETDFPLSSNVKTEHESIDGWDEDWDEDWEDTEAARASSRAGQSPSSNGLAVRRSNKEGWESWDD